MLCTPQIIDTPDDMSREQLVAELVKQNIIRGAADNFSLEPITEWAADSSTIIDDELHAPNGAAGEVRREGNSTDGSAEI